MSRTEEIKGRFKRGYYNADSDRDIEYLLSKLEIAEKELQWAFEREGWMRTKEVLDSIRED